MQSDGWLHAWRWNPTAWRWAPYAPVLLPPSRDPRSFGAGRSAPRRRLTAVTASAAHGSSSSSSSSFSPTAVTSVSAGGRIVFWCETYVREDNVDVGNEKQKKHVDGKDEKKEETAAATKQKNESEANTAAATANGKEAPRPKKKKEYMRLCWSELWFEEVSRPASAGPSKPSSYNSHGDPHSSGLSFFISLPKLTNLAFCCPLNTGTDDDDDDDDGSAAHVGKANLTDTLEGDIHTLFSSKEGAWLMTGTTFFFYLFYFILFYLYDFF